MNAYQIIHLLLLIYNSIILLLELLVPLIIILLLYSKYLDALIQKKEDQLTCKNCYHNHTKHIQHNCIVQVDMKLKCNKCPCKSNKHHDTECNQTYIERKFLRTEKKLVRHQTKKCKMEFHIIKVMMCQYMKHKV